MSDEILKDCSSDCGCMAEIGTIIHENDTVYDFKLEGNKEKVLETFAKYEEAAKAVDSTVKINFKDNEGDSFVREGTFEFSCSAEKMIFQMRSGAL